MSDASAPLVFAHLGDLHIVDAKSRNYLDLLAIAAQLEMEAGDALDFVVLPGDNADNGLPEQYALVATALKMIGVPVHAITGDHDMEPGSLDNFYAGLGAARLPKSLIVRGRRCLFLDICGPGSGGPDFRMGADQLGWLERELGEARSAGQTSLLFVHTYPDDLKGEGETAALNALIARHDVALVDMGHTHYNELANDGATIFAATRSTGQIEEGPVGYTIATLDQGVVSWRFKALDDPFPFVIITAPADHRLLRGPAQTVKGECDVRAIVLGRRGVEQVECQVADGAWAPMTRAEGSRCWAARVPVGTDRLFDLTVRATDVSGRPGLHAIRVGGEGFVPPPRTRAGSDADAVGPWPENGIFGTQLGPNRNGKPSS